MEVSGKLSALSKPFVPVSTPLTESVGTNKESEIISGESANQVATVSKDDSNLITILEKTSTTAEVLLRQSNSNSTVTVTEDDDDLKTPSQSPLPSTMVVQSTS